MTGTTINNDQPLCIFSTNIRYKYMNIDKNIILIGDWHHDLYHDLVAPTLKTNLITETLCYVFRWLAPRLIMTNPYVFFPRIFVTNTWTLTKTFPFRWLAPRFVPRFSCTNLENQLNHWNMATRAWKSWSHLQGGLHGI